MLALLGGESDMLRCVCASYQRKDRSWEAGGEVETSVGEERERADLQL